MQQAERQVLIPHQWDPVEESSGVQVTLFNCKNGEAEANQRGNCRDCRQTRRTMETRRAWEVTPRAGRDIEEDVDVKVAGAKDDAQLHAAGRWCSGSCAGSRARGSLTTT